MEKHLVIQTLMNQILSFLLMETTYMLTPQAGCIFQQLMERHGIKKVLILIVMNLVTLVILYHIAVI